MSQIVKRYTKELIALFGLLLFSVLISTYITGSQLNGSLQNLYLNNLTALKNSLKVNIEAYFNEKKNIVTTLSQTTDVKNALISFSQSYQKIADEYTKDVDNTKLLSLIANHTKRTFYNIPNSSLKKPFKEYIATDIRGNILQNLYIADSPFSSQSKYMLFNSKENLSYDMTHKQYHQEFVNILQRHNFYDIFLIDIDGNIIYSVYKELDFGTNLKSGIYKESSLALAYKSALQSDTLSFSDFKSYEPSYNRAASFFAIPIKDKGKTLGVIAFQLSIEEIDNIMTFNDAWEDIGLGKSGESYLVGQDYLMRSDSRFQVSMENKIVNELATTVGILNVKSDAVVEALEGKNNQAIITDYRGVEVLSSYTSVNILDKVWALVVEIDKDEVTGNIIDVVKTLFITGIVLIVLSILLFGYIFLRLIVKPIESFEKELEKQVEQRNRELKKSTAILNDYKKAVDEGVIVSKTDKRGIITYVNDKFCQISGYSREELVGKAHNIVRHSDTPKAVFEEIWRTILNKRVWKGIIKNHKKEGGNYIVQSTIVPIVDEQQNIVEFIAIRIDITDLIQQEKKILEQSTDEITHLPNRIKLLEDIADDSKKKKLAILQIDKFKEINDFYGIDKSNLILLSMSSIFKSIAMDNITIYKIGEGEFALLSNVTTTMHDFVKIVENIIKYCDHNIVAVEGDSFNISISAGIAKGSKTKLFFNAEMALRKAYENSKSLVAFENAQDIEQEYENNILMTKKIKEAIKSDNILVYAQLIKANGTSTKSKYECLVRMRDSDEILSPYYFLDIAKKARLYPTLTKIVIEKSFEYFYDKKDEFSINLTIEDILNDDIVIFLKKKLQEFKIAHRVVIELVESEGIENFDDVYAFITEFKAYGCKIAIDDFGTGYSNFEYLIKLDVDYIKIDGSLIKNIDTDESAQLVVELIVDFAKRMNIKTIAEFVHNEAVYQKIKEIGIEFSQGYHLGKPTDLESL